MTRFVAIGILAFSQGTRALAKRRSLHLRKGVAENDGEKTIYFVRHVQTSVAKSTFEIIFLTVGVLQVVIIPRQRDDQFFYFFWFFSDFFSQLISKRIKLLLNNNNPNIDKQAQALHNKDEAELENWDRDQLGYLDKYRDTDLTTLGEMQCRELAKQWENQVDLIVVSPLTRTLKTATMAFPQGPHPFLATELARERIAYHKCDQRSPISSLRTKFPHVDFSQVSYDDDVLWETKENDPDEFNSTKCKDRALELLTWLSSRPERRIAVVTHWVFLRHLFRIFPDADLHDIKVGNAEFYSFRLFSHRSSSEL